MHRAWLSYTRDWRLKISSERLGNEDKVPCQRAQLLQWDSNSHRNLRYGSLWSSLALRMLGHGSSPDSTIFLTSWDNVKATIVLVDLLKIFLIFRKWTIPSESTIKPTSNTLLKPKRHSLRCHGFVVHALLLCMHTNVVDFRVMQRLCRCEWNWKSVNQHSWDPRQRTTWSRRVTSDFNSVLFWMTCCNVIIPNNKISLCILLMAECSGVPRAFWYFGYFLTIWAFLSKQFIGH